MSPETDSTPLYKWSARHACGKVIDFSAPANLTAEDAYGLLPPSLLAMYGELTEIVSRH